ncbi:hypothetical protein J31TS4_41140 [Paenibacillus sp. J31TS4]|nr:hypothetical protein J31TS4_41140 [Paenibacillus sp. J31TS4]
MPGHLHPASVRRLLESELLLQQAQPFPQTFQIPGKLQPHALVPSPVQWVLLVRPASWFAKRTMRANRRTLQRLRGKRLQNPLVLTFFCLTCK